MVDNESFRSGSPDSNSWVWQALLVVYSIVTPLSLVHADRTGALWRQRDVASPSNPVPYFPSFPGNHGWSYDLVLANEI